MHLAMEEMLAGTEGKYWSFIICSRKCLVLDLGFEFRLFRDILQSRLNLERNSALVIGMVIKMNADICYRRRNLRILNFFMGSINFHLGQAMERGFLGNIEM
ncbi:hypothetical protein CDAR_212581 [Caerostris darwini]|uniref:Uncharacterized protein n=1 Tax=Caerostris darwini TaxID=1538125 RepID=A0AAV4PXC1_9ARAC|nr:hypothetical protein CDAR_212581 [Caerostris darwini]